MRNLLLFVLAATVAVGCSRESVDELTNSPAVEGRSLVVSLDEEGDETRIQLNEDVKTVWNEGDLVSVFYRSTVNEQWQFQGKTGDRTGNILPVDSSIVPPATGNDIVVVYPYNDGYFYNSDTKNVQATLPSEQTYLKDSYGLDGNIMVSSSEYNQITLKSVCGWLKLQLTGEGEEIESITVRGNSGEQVAGELYINTADATSTLASQLTESDDDSEVSGTLVRPGTILTEVTLNCLDGSSPTEKGVALGTEATSFYIALPPQTFAKGITVEITAIDGSTMTKATDKVVVIERNHIKPMSAFAAEFPVPETWKIYYTATAKVEPYDKTVFGATYVSNEWNSETGKGVITFEGDVTEIGARAFFNRSIKSVTIPDSVTTIGKQAFYYCSSLTSVTIPDSVTTIGEDAFHSCSKLTSVTIPDSVTTIGERAFSSCNSLTSVTIGNSVTTIGKSAFNSCSNLTSVTIPDSVTTIGGGAFYNCSSLTSVTIPDSVTTIGESVFSSCDSLKEFKGKFAADGGRCLIVDGVLNAFAIGCGATQYTIPDSVTTIGSSAFSSCSSLTSVTIPNSVTTIGYMAFYDCDSLTSVTIPNSVTTIEEEAFYYCPSLTSVTIGNSVTTIGESAFEYCESLESVTIGDSVTTIGERAFSSCYSLTSVTIPDSVTTIGEYAFYECLRLTSVTIPDSVTTIGVGTFAYCFGLTSVTIPDSVTTIGNYAFSHCLGLTSVTIPNSVTTIGEYAFCRCESLTSVTIPDSITTIGEEAFSNCYSLTSVTIGNSVTTIGDGAFAYCYSLKEFKGKFAADGGRCLIVDGVLNAFALGCGVTQYTIPDSVTTIGVRAFQECYSLKSVTIPDDVTTIGSCAFESCTSLTSVTIPDSVTTIGEYAFYYCESLATVYCKRTTPPAGGYSMFDDNAAGRRIFVPASEDDSIINAYKAASYWWWYEDYIFEEE